MPLRWWVPNPASPACRLTTRLVGLYFLCRHTASFYCDDNETSSRLQVFVLSHPHVDSATKMSSLLFGNGTDIVHWKPSSETRGTFDILSTCIITMLLCVWTAVHLNVSPPGNVWTPRLRKVGWMILALLAPELVAYTAWYVCSIEILMAKTQISRMLQKR